MLKSFTPNLLVPSVCDIPLAEFAARGMRGLLFDLDNTLLDHYGDEFAADIVSFMGQARDHGFRLCIVSNGPDARTLRLAEKLGVAGVARSGKPGTRGLSQALGRLNLQPGQAAMVGDQIFTDVWAGNRLGLYTVLVAPYGPHEPWHIKLKRAAEWGVLRSLGVRTRGPEPVVLDGRR